MEYIRVVAQIELNKCNMCGGLWLPFCVEACPDEAIRVQNNRIVITEFLCEDCNECGCVCPDKAISIPVDKVTF